MNSLQRQWLQASGERVKLIEFDRDRQLEALDEQELGEQRYAEATVLINRTADAEIAEQRQREAEQVAKTNDDAAKSTFKLGEAFQGFGSVATSAFEDAIVAGEKLSVVLEGLVQDIQRLLIRNALNMLMDAGMKAGSSWVGSLFGPSTPTTTTTTGNSGWVQTRAYGGVYGYGGNVIPFARGGIVREPTLFRFAQGTGLMGEAGPEAVLPLTRLPSGKLGVGSAGGPAVVNNVTVVNNHPGAKVSSEEQPNGRGGVDLTVVIDAVEQAMAQRLQRPGTTLNRALGTASNPIRAR
jgi:phage-related minor tail protein